MKNVLYAQLIGVAAMLTISFSVQCRKKKHMMMVQSFAHMLYAFQYALLGAISAAYMDIMAVVISEVLSFFALYIFYKYDKNRRQVPIVLSGIIIIVTGIIGYLNYTNPLSLLPVIVAILYTIGATFKDARVYKYVFGFCAIAWLFYNLKFKAYVCVIGNIMEITSTIIALVRETKNKNKK